VPKFIWKNNVALKHGKNMKYMVMLGCVPADLEQHDIFLELVLP
jgi:hypothetical protein